MNNEELASAAWRQLREATLAGAPQPPPDAAADTTWQLIFDRIAPGDALDNGAYLMTAPISQPTNPDPTPNPSRRAPAARWLAASLAALVVVALVAVLTQFHSAPPAVGQHGGTVVVPTPRPFGGNGKCPAEYSNPGITHSIALGEISMVSPTEGWAVGGLDHFGTGVSQGILLHFINGQWVTDTDLANAQDITSLSMDSPTDGWLTVDVPNAQYGSLAHYDGQHWQPVPLPVVAPTQPPGTTYMGSNSFSNLTVRMYSATDGWIMPFQSQTNGQATLLHYDGTAWRIVKTPYISTDLKFYQFYDFAVTGPNELWIAGNYTDDSGTASSGQTVRIIHYLNGQWSASTNLPGGPNGTIDQIAMASSTNGWAYGEIGQGYPSVLLHYDGKSWQKAALPYTAADSLGGLAGLTTGPDGSLWAIETEGINGSIANTVSKKLVHLVNGQWQSQTLPNPSTDPLLPFQAGEVVPLANGDIWVMGDILHQRNCGPLEVTGIAQGVILQEHNGQWTQTIEPVG